MHKFSHIGINAKDMEESIKFYTDILKCKVLEDTTRNDMRLVFLDAGGTIVELVYKEGNRFLPDGPINHLAFNVENLDNEILFLKNNGIVPLGAPRISEKSKIVFFRGPNGERLEFLEQIK